MKPILWLPAAVLVGILMAASGSAQETGTLTRLDFSALIAAARVQGPLDFCGEPVPLAEHDVRERMEREMLSALSDPHQVILWIKRSRQYLTPIEEALRRHRLPEDLKYLAIAESALKPHASSFKGAIGFWQFIEPTGRKYGLQVDSEKDERRNLFTSTEAAIAYLRVLNDLFGSWTLAAAAYNMGEYGLRNEINLQETPNYYRLHLPLETQRYIFRILAAKLILTDPGRFGFQLEPGDIYPAIACERVSLNSQREIPLLAVARSANTYPKVIKDLNPEIRGYRLAPGQHGLWVPKGAAEGFHERLERAMTQMDAERQEVFYVVKEGDTLSGIAEQHKVSLSDLRLWNRLDPKKAIHPGMRLVIQMKTAFIGKSGS